MPAERSESGELMDRAAAGDDEAFSRLASLVQDRLYRFALAHLLNPADAAEATQEALLRAYQARRRWRPGGDAVAWMYGVTMNVVREMWRRRKASHLNGSVLEAWLSVGRLAVGGRDGEDEVREQLDALARAIASLPPRQREAVSCRYLRQLDTRQTAAVMGCAEGTVKAAVHAALGNLRAILNHEQGA